MIQHPARASRRLATLALAAAFLPLLLVQIVPSDTVDQYGFKAEVVQTLGDSGNGQLQYFRAVVLTGMAPDDVLVTALDRNYSRGYTPGSIAPESTCWFKGDLMMPDVFYGEQYLFFDTPQVYVRQVKTGLLWPDQWTGMRVLYLSPLATLAAPVQLPFLLQSDSFTWRMLAVLAARCIVLGTVIALAAKKTLRGADLPMALFVLILVSMLVTMPVLRDLY